MHTQYTVLVYWEVWDGNEGSEWWGLCKLVNYERVTADETINSWCWPPNQQMTNYKFVWTYNTCKSVNNYSTCNTTVVMLDSLRIIQRSSFSVVCPCPLTTETESIQCVTVTTSYKCRNNPYWRQTYYFVSDSTSRQGYVELSTVRCETISCS